MLYFPGEVARYTFTVPDADGDNVSGLTWSLLALAKDNQRLTSGAEFTSFSITEHASGLFYIAAFTPAQASSSQFGIFAKSDADPEDYFELHLEPDWGRIVLLAEKIEHLLTSPEQVKFYMPDGTTLIKTFNMTQVGNTETRTGV